LEGIPSARLVVSDALQTAYTGFFALGHATTSPEPEKWHDGAKNGAKRDGTVTCVAAPLHHEGVSGVFSFHLPKCCPLVDAGRCWIDGTPVTLGWFLNLPQVLLPFAHNLPEFALFLLV
jgi:hypothetical protein